MNRPYAQEGRLDPTAHERILIEEVIPQSDLQIATTQPCPKAIILAGQPGAGKGGLADTARSQFFRDAVKIDPDELRRYHPDVRRFRTEHPYTWPTHTHPDASQWAKELRQVAIEQKKNLIIDTTLGDGDNAVAMIKNLQAQGYEVEVRAIATHWLESELGVDRRFTVDLDEYGFGRYVPADIRASVYDALPATLDQVRTETGVPVSIYNREGRQLYDSRTASRSAAEALTDARAQRLADVRRVHALRDNYYKQLGWHRELPDALPEHPKVAPEAKGPLMHEHTSLRIEPGLVRNAPVAERAYRAAAEQARGMATRTLGAVGVVAAAYDAAEAAHRTAELLHQGNVTGAQSGLLHLGGRTLGMVAGAEALGGLGTLAGVESGPGMIVTGAIGGVAGAFGGEKLMDAVDHYRVYHQRDPHGLPWRYDPEHPEQRWVTDLPPLPGGAKRPVADEALQNRLDYQASTKLAELRMATPGELVDPYRQPAGPNDPARVRASDWMRDAQSHAWTRSVITEVVGRIPVHGTETASPDRAAELDRAAEQTVMHNWMHSPQGVAAAYLAMYEQRGWANVGPVPEAVTANLRDIDRTVMASDGHTYARDVEGQWSTPGWLYGRNTAEGAVRDELELTRRMERAMPEGSEKPVAEPSHPSEAKPLLPTRLDDPTHPDHAFFRQTRGHVHALDRSLGRTPDLYSDQIASMLTVQARADGLQRIDRIALSDDGNKLWAVQAEPQLRIGVFDRLTNVPTASANMPMEQSGAQWPQAMQQFDQLQRETQERSQAIAQDQTQSQQQAQGMGMGR
jgi:hypothetical protein